MSAAPRPQQQAELRLANSLDAAPRALPAAESQRAEDRKPHGAPQPMPPQHSMRGLRRVMLACACGSAAIGAVGLFAWHTGTVLLLTWHAGFTALHYNSAVLLVLGGASLASVALNRRLLAGAMALLVTGFAGLIACNELFSLYLGLNAILFPQTVVATRVAPNTALALLVAGIGLLLLTIPLRFTWRGAAISGLGSVVTIAAAVSLFGYVFAVSAAYRWREFNPMSLPAAVGLALLGVGLVVAGRLQTKMDRAQGPQPLTVTLAIALAAASLLLWEPLAWQRDLANPQSSLPEVTLGAALLVSSLAVVATWLAQVARQRSRSLQLSGMAVRAERQRLHAVMDMLPAYVVLLAPDYRVPFANRFFEQRFGKSQGRRCYEYLFQRDSPCENCESFKVMQTRAPHHWEWLGPDGRNYDISDFPFTDSDGSPLVMEVGLDVTERLRAEEATRLSEQRYRSLALATAQIVWTTDANGLVCGDMPTWREFTGFSYQQIQGWGWLDSLHPEDRPRTAEAWQQATAARTFYEIEYRLLRHDGEYRHVWVRGVPVLETGGAVREWVGTCTDVTDRKRLQQQLEAQQFYNRSLLEASLDPLVTISREGKITDVNCATEEVTGAPRAELIGSDFCCYFSEPDKARAGYRRAFAEGEIKDYPLAIRHRDGHVTDVLYNATVFRNRGGEVEGVFAAARDITQRQKAEEALRRSQQRFQLHVERTPLAVVEWNTNFEVVAWNPGAERMFGYSRQEVLGRPARSLVPADAWPPVERVLHDVAGNCGGLRSTNPNLRRDGTVIECEWYNTALIDRGGQVIGIASLAQDITERRRAEEQLQRYAAELERSNAELQDFAAIASHDLQEPLRKVLAFGDRLKEHCGPALDDTGQDFLRRMQNAAARMSLLIESLLQYSRVTSRAQPFEPVDLTQVMIEVLADLDLSIRTAKAKVAFDVLPMVSADRLQMRQLLQNLIANALKFQPGCRLTAVGPRQDQPESQPLIAETRQPTTDDHRPEVVIEAAVQDGLCTLRVCDNGIGFEETYLDRIFRPFQRLHGRQEYPGSGMGLAICRKIVQRHGGNITAHSKLGNGSTFEVTLPLGSGQWPVVSGQQDVVSRSVLTTGH